MNFTARPRRHLPFSCGILAVITGSRRLSHCLHTRPPRTWPLRSDKRRCPCRFSNGLIW